MNAFYVDESLFCCMKLKEKFYFVGPKLVSETITYIGFQEFVLFLHPLFVSVRTTR